MDNLRKGDLCIIRHEGDEVRAIVAYTGDAIDVHTIDGEFRITEADFVRKVTLKSYATSPCNLWEMAGCAARYLRATQTETEALDAICYMLGGKLHKYMSEAWLGGADVGEDA